MIRKAPLVPRTERPVMGLQTDKNCVYTNALQMIRCAATQGSSACKQHPLFEQDNSSQQSVPATKSCSRSSLPAILLL